MSNRQELVRALRNIGIPMDTLIFWVISLLLIRFLLLSVVVVVLVVVALVNAAVVDLWWCGGVFWVSFQLVWSRMQLFSCFRCFMNSSQFAKM